ISVNDNIYSLISKGGIHGWSILNDDEELYSDDVDEEDVINKLSLKLIVDDLSNPLIEFVFYEDERGIDTESEEFEEIWEECKNWHKKFSIIIKRDQREKVAVNSWVHH